MATESDHELYDFIRQCEITINAEYKRIRKRAKEDPGTAGDEGESTWAGLLEQWLPGDFRVVKKGRILTHSGYCSPQLDVLILRPSYPKLLLDKKVYLAGGVAAAFECKLTLQASHIKNFVMTVSTVRRQLEPKHGTPYSELISDIRFGLLAHSHSWKAKKSKPIEVIEKTLWEADLSFVRHPIECLDFICVSDLATWQVSKSPYVGPLCSPQVVSDLLLKEYGPDGASLSGYICSAIAGENQKDTFSPLGCFLTDLCSALAWNYPDLRELVQYFHLVGVSGSGRGYQRKWKVNDIFSETLRNGQWQSKLKTGPLERYSEWRSFFD